MSKTGPLLTCTDLCKSEKVPYIGGAPGDHMGRWRGVSMCDFGRLNLRHTWSLVPLLIMVCLSWLQVFLGLSAYHQQLLERLGVRCLMGKKPVLRLFDIAIVESKMFIICPNSDLSCLL